MELLEQLVKREEEGGKGVEVYGITDVNPHTGEEIDGLHVDILLPNGVLNTEHVGVHLGEIFLGILVQIAESNDIKSYGFDIRFIRFYFQEDSYLEEYDLYQEGKLDSGTYSRKCSTSFVDLSKKLVSFHAEDMYESCVRHIAQSMASFENEKKGHDVGAMDYFIHNIPDWWFEKEGHLDI